MAQRKIIYYDFDLDLNPIDRWVHIFDQFDSELPKLRKQIGKILKEFAPVLPIIKTIFNLMDSTQIMFYDEISFISTRMGVEVYQIVLLQLIYETSAACTTAIFNVGGVSGTEYFFRTMDWPMKFLKDITIGLDIKRGGESVSKVIGWLGCVGFFTAQTDSYAIAINYRRTTELSIAQIVVNAYRTFNMNWPISYLVRSVIENDNQPDRMSIIKLFETAQLISPTYITICAYESGLVCGSKSVIITRDWDKLVSTRSHDLIQCNCDFDKSSPDIMWSLERKELFGIIIAELNEQPDYSKKTILKSLLVQPIVNDDTIYIYFSSGTKSIAFI